MNTPIQSLFVYGTNPAVVAPDANKVRKGLEREDLFTVVHELFITETAMYADIVLPATSAFENIDFYTSYWHHYIHLHEPVIHPFGESKSNTDVFRMLAKAMEFDEPEFKDNDEELIKQSLIQTNNPSLKHVTYEKLKKKGI